MELTKLKEFRKNKKITIGELSKRTNIHRDRISLIERGKVNPSYETVETIVKSLGLEIVLMERV